MTLTAVPGVEVGHWTDAGGGTGVTVVVLPEPNVTAVEIRGAAPGTREVALLAPGMKVQSVQAIALCGGSAFGLAAVDGVVRELERAGRGFPTPLAMVPIVPAAVLFDLAVGSPAARPGPEEGVAAFVAASGDPVEMGNVGAGTGASVASWRGFDKRLKGGLGSASLRVGEVTVGAVVVVNAAGDVFTLEGEPLTGADPIPGPPAWAGGSFENTTLAVLATDAALDRNELSRLCVRGQDAIAACIRPGHTRYDGDAVFAVSCGELSGDPDALGEAAFTVMGKAIEAALRAARPVPGLPALEDGK